MLCVSCSSATYYVCLRRSEPNRMHSLEALLAAVCDLKERMIMLQSTVEGYASKQDGKIGSRHLLPAPADVSSISSEALVLRVTAFVLGSAALIFLMRKHRPSATPVPRRVWW